ncbi:hypothetical protein SYNPS1DRAFT_26631 [Syncephalis pseudoplumigaleata]|uniref:Uncharacterized protein n=1 Tax=Syncephalis pseudoplumigaleata TaxID=1712513 RepID=A0A4P9Z773_9FUNG|nr:hypothetical protein SYNPS1DRAFT_26631 [Syncephalis pseudoplumigaleata]|eukprot:RKP27731.1 hypothetical protein SYNPS1DRAFT_26631 [Syncephalis pseudoplumigaleata]
MCRIWRSTSSTVGGCMGDAGVPLLMLRGSGARVADTRYIQHCAHRRTLLECHRSGELYGTLKRVPRGTYQVVWLLYISREAFSLQDLEFSAQVLDQTVNAISTSKPGADRLRGDDERALSEYAMPELLRVTPDHDYADVRFDVKDISQSWKGGIVGGTAYTIGTSM